MERGRPEAGRDVPVPSGTRLPRIAVTMGDPAGIGPEVVARAVGHPAVMAVCRPVVYAVPEVMASAAALVETGPGGGAGALDGVEVVAVEGPRPGEFEPGVVSAACGRAALACLQRAAMDVLRGTAAALCTAPINKEAVAAAGCRDAGHLEYLARMTRAGETATVLVAGRLRCLHLTTHCSLADAVRSVTRERILARLRLARHEMGKYGIRDPEIAVCALNPHGGEGGLFGRDELDVIGPAVREAVAEGIRATGPHPADSLLALAAGGAKAAGAAGGAKAARIPDLVLVLYHDQGHIAVKVHDLAHSYTVALGLPVVRTAVDHGTAFDVAWQGKADARSMVAAIIAAAAFHSGRWPDPEELA